MAQATRDVFAFHEGISIAMAISIRRRRGNSILMMAGAGTITLDQGLRPRPIATARDGLAGDWKAVGGDLRRAPRGGSKDFEAS
jgi:hypothetical protein